MQQEFIPSTALTKSLVVGYAPVGILLSPLPAEKWRQTTAEINAACASLIDSATFKLKWLLHPMCALKTATLLREPFLTLWEDPLCLSPVSYAHSEVAEVQEAAQQGVRSYPSPCLFLLILQTVSNTEKSKKTKPQ